MKTMHQIREMLCEEIDALRAKTTTPANVNAIVNATGKILTTVKMEMEYAKLMNKQPDLQFMALGIADAEVSDSSANETAHLTAEKGAENEK
jgi:hypothetical protein